MHFHSEDLHKVALSTESYRGDMNKESHLVLEGITQTRDFENTQE